jgi:hypothetical protein
MTLNRKRLLQYSSMLCPALSIRTRVRLRQGIRVNRRNGWDSMEALTITLSPSKGMGAERRPTS